jgi:hypothetical protein
MNWLDIIKFIEHKSPAHTLTKFSEGVTQINIIPNISKDLDDLIDYYNHTYKIISSCLFISLDRCYGLGDHIDNECVTLHQLLGNMQYKVKNEIIDLKPNQVLHLGYQVKHQPLANYPRATLSLVLNDTPKREEVNYYYE